MSDLDYGISSLISSLSNSTVQTIGPELIFGQLYDKVGYNQVDNDMFRHLVIARLAFPLSKLKTCEYLYRYQGKSINISKVYRFIDKLSNSLQEQIEEITYKHTLSILSILSIVFYDMTTLYFDASDEDDLRKTGFSKEGKHQKPQIYLGLLVGPGGYAIAYDIYEGNIHESHTLIPFLEKVSKRFNLGKPIVVADSGLLSQKNIMALTESGYTYILGARIKNENNLIKQQILSHDYQAKSTLSIQINEDERLIVNYSEKRSKKDIYNRKRGLLRLEKRIHSGKLTKSNINNRGYNKFLKLKGTIEVEMDYDKIESDKNWDGLKGYKTNSTLSEEKILENYGQLWYIERAFRMSKTDLRIRPIYHRKRDRIEAHICISFAAYTIYKELERALKRANSNISVQAANELTHNMYQIVYTLPDSRIEKKQILKMDLKQQELYEIVENACRVSQ
jgi:transposase